MEDIVYFSIVHDHKYGDVGFSVPSRPLTRKEYNDIVLEAHYALKALEANVKEDDCVPKCVYPSNEREQK